MQYVLRGNIKSQALAKFIVKLNSPIKEDPPFEWALFVDGASNIKGRGARVVIEGPGYLL